MSQQQTGTIKSIGATQQVSDKFSKRDLVIGFADGTYDKILCVQFTQTKCAVLDGYQVGQEVTVDFNLESKEHNGRYFTNATAWRVVPSGQQQNYQAPQPAATGSQNAGYSAPAQGNFYNPAPEEADNLPFRFKIPRINS